MDQLLSATPAEGFGLRVGGPGENLALMTEPFDKAWRVGTVGEGQEGLNLRFVDFLAIRSLLVNRLTTV